MLEVRLTPQGARLHVQVTFARRKPLYIGTCHLRLRTRTPEPRRVQLRHSREGLSSATVTLKVTRPRR